MFENFKNKMKEKKAEKRRQRIEETRKKDEELWNAIWDDIYECQEKYPKYMTDEKADELDLKPVIGRNGKPVWATREQSRKLFCYRIGH